MNTCCYNTDLYIIPCCCSPPGVQADICPTGYFCPQGTDDPLPCPQRTYNPNTNIYREDQCVNCTGGSYCNQTGAVGKQSSLPGSVWSMVTLTNIHVLTSSLPEQRQVPRVGCTLPKLLVFIVFTSILLDVDETNDRG